MKSFIHLARVVLISTYLLISGGLSCEQPQDSSDSKDDMDYTLGDRVLAWPIDCMPGEDCYIGHADINGDGLAYDCGSPGYPDHQGTDINTSWAQMDSGVSVFAAADGMVLWVFDGKYDRCPDDSEPDCQDPGRDFSPGMSSGFIVCTELGDYCEQGDCCCFWCFAGGNVIVILHDTTPGVFATRYDHLKKYSITVLEGERVTKG